MNNKNNNNNVSALRRDYIFNESRSLKESEVDPNPFVQFESWMNEALKTVAIEANAMSLATCTRDGKPSLRTVLLKGYSEDGFLFFTNYTSRKGKELELNPYASLLFFWKELERQIRIEGKTEQLTKVESEKYFHSRPFESQIAALASKQSSVIENREVLERKFDELKQKYEGSTAPPPDKWGGYKLIPDRIEFWQGRQNRMHDRILYSFEKDGWKIERLSP